MNDFVAKYAELSLAADSFRSAGMPVPFELAQTIQRIEQRAQQVLSPAQMRSALDHVEAAKIRILNEEQARNYERAEKQADDVIGSMTETMFANHPEGLTRAQLNAVRQGKPVKFAPTGEYFNPAKADKSIRQQTKRFDPRGRGFGLKEWENRLEELVNADDAKFKRLAKKYNAPEAEVRQMADKWGNERYSFEMRKRQASRTPLKDEVHKPSDEHQRRAHIIDAYVNTVDTDSKVEMEQLFDGISSESLEDDGMRGDIARAFAEHEERDDAA